MDWEDAVTELQTLTLQILRDKHPHGINEMALMDELDVEGLELFSRAARHQPEMLFRAHFILFHALYRLRPALFEEGLELDIHCLNIRLRQSSTTRPSRGALSEPDEVAAYYLDSTNLEGMDDAAVEQLITDGLRRCLGDPPEQTSNHTSRDEALATLGLDEGVNQDQIRHAYRRLAMRHHPDRGGDTATLQRVNEAYRVLIHSPVN